MTIKNHPATPLPLSVARNVQDTQRDHARINDAEGRHVATVVSRPLHFSDAERFARYLAHASNAYPKLVKALQDQIARQDAKFAGQLLEEKIGSLRALLRELGEAS